MTLQTRKESALMGALVADAAALGAHWIYDVGRIAELRTRYGATAFMPVDAAHFEGGVGYYAHGARHTGMPTQYGAVLGLAMGVIRAKNGFDVAAYQAAFAGFFGAGGAYHGYIDRPTRGTLANLAAEQTDPSGIDDDQLPATATLPAVIVAHHGKDDLSDRVRAAIAVTNVNDVAQAYGDVFASLLGAVLDGLPLDNALDALTDPAVRAALDTAEPDSTAYGEVTGRACHLPMAMPLCVHILARATSYEEAILRNIEAGGDSAGRAIIIGAVAGAVYGVDGSEGIPLAWSLRLENGAALWDDCRALAAP